MTGNLPTGTSRLFRCSCLTDPMNPVMRMAILKIFQVVQRLFAVEDPNVLRLGRRQTPDGPTQVHEVRLDRCVQRMHSDLARQVVRLPGVAGTAGGDDVRPVVRAPAGEWNEV